MKTVKLNKPSPFGIIPNEWKIEELCDIVEEGRSVRYGIVQPGIFEPNGRYLIRGQDYSFGWVEPNKLFRVSEEIESKYKNARVKTGDILITIVGAGCGNIEIVPEWLNGANITQTTARIAIDKSKAIPNYIAHFLKSNFGKKLTYINIKGGAQPGLNCGDVEKFEIVLPKIPEQIKIAKILSTWDAAIENLEQLIEKKERYKKALMQQLLTGKKRFKEFKSKIKKTCFTEVADLKHGYQFRDYDFIEKGIPVIKIGNLTGGGDLSLKNLSFVDEGNLEKNKSFLISQGDLLMALSGATIGKVSYVNIPIGKMLQNYRVGNFICKPNKINKFYLYYILQSDFVQLRVFSLMNTGAQPNIGKGDFDKIFFPLPEIEEQNKIASFLFSSDEEIRNLNIKLRHTKEQKNGLMQQLLTGKIRV